MVAEICLLALGAFARIIELRLHARQPIEKLIALGLQLIDFGLSAGLYLLFRLGRGHKLIGRRQLGRGIDLRSRCAAGGVLESSHLQLFCLLIHHDSALSPNKSLLLVR